MKKRNIIYFIFVGLLFLTSCNCKKPSTTVDTPNSYSVYYYNDGIDSARNEIKVSDGEYFQITNVPQKEGYDFLGYYEDVDFGEKVVNALGIV